MAENLNPFDKIGKYELRRQVGRGAMGVVYEAWDNLNRPVALKMLRVDRIDAADLPEMIARFKREAQSLARLAHPHIVTIHDYGDWQGSPFLVMEFMQGRDLAQELKSGARFPLDVVVRIMTQMLGALSHAHERGVVHRDLKPANMFLLEDDSLKVVDFGLAKIQDSDLSTLTKMPTVMGTPAYMSPEQVDALPADHRSDLFSAGIILYELLTGERPFKGDSTHTIQQAVRKLDPLAPSDANPTLSPVWDRVIARALAKKPSARYENARQFSEAIKDAQQAEREHAEESRLKAAEAAEHALRAAEERSRAETLRRADEERREAERTAREEGEARVAAEEKAKAEAAARVAAEDATKAEAWARIAATAKAQAEGGQVNAPKQRTSRAPLIAAVAVLVLAVIGGVLYSRQGDQERVAPVLAAAEAKRKADEAARKETTEKAAADAAKKAEEAKQAARKPGEVFQDCPDCPRMVVIPVGEFTMGSPDSETGRYESERPQHRVVIARPFAAGRYEVMFDEWDACHRDSGCSHNPPDNRWGRGNRPVIDVSWPDAQQYVSWLSRKTGKRYRLLTEAEWEYASRARTTTAYSTGEGIASSQANFGHSVGQTVPVGTYRPNAFGLFDVHGNVWEWTEDCWNSNYIGAPRDGAAWVTGDCSQRVIRGGSWGDSPRGARSANRGGNATGSRGSVTGFRLARTLE